MGLRDVTVASLYTQIRLRADVTGATTLVPDAELLTYINLEYTELYEEVVGAFGSDYYMTSQTFNTSSGTSVYTMSASVYELVGVDVNLGGGDIIACKQFAMQERNYYNSSVLTSRGWVVGDPIYYRLRAHNTIAFIPAPTGVYAVTIWYVPAPAVLTGGDSVDGEAGWEEFIIAGAAARLAARFEDDPTQHLRSKDTCRERIRRMAARRDAASPPRVIDVKGWMAEGCYE